MKASEAAELMKRLKARFEDNRQRHPGIEWDEVEGRLRASPKALSALQGMESTGGEPDLVGREEGSGALVFCDCSPESPAGRRSLCYDREALEARKEHKPRDSALGMAEDLGISVLTEEQYRELQTLGDFDLKTSSWIRTPDAVRKLGGALFGDRRYDRVFVYHNGAESYYGVRGFRGRLVVGPGEGA